MMMPTWGARWGALAVLRAVRGERALAVAPAPHRSHKPRFGTGTTSLRCVIRSSTAAAAAAELATFSAADVLEAQDKRGAIDPAVRPLWRPIAVSGPAFTVRAPSGDNLALHRALAEV